MSQKNNDTSEAGEWNFRPSDYQDGDGRPYLELIGGGGGRITTGPENTVKAALTYHNAEVAALREQLERYQRHEQWREKMGIKTEDAKWVDPECHGGCQSLKFKAETAKLREEADRMCFTLQALRDQCTPPRFGKERREFTGKIWCDYVKHLCDEALTGVTPLPQGQTHAQEKAETRFASEVKELAAYWHRQANNRGLGYSLNEQVTYHDCATRLRGIYNRYVSTKHMMNSDR